MADVTASNLIEYAACSNRGSCSLATGVCSCFRGFDGPACNRMSGAVKAPTDNDVLLVHAKNAAFTGSAVAVKADRAAATAFGLLKATAGGVDVFELKGSGDLTMHKGGLTVVSCFAVSSP